MVLLCLAVVEGSMLLEATLLTHIQFLEGTMANGWQHEDNSGLVPDVSIHNQIINRSGEGIAALDGAGHSSEGACE